MTKQRLKVFIDLNVVLDLAWDREPYATFSQEVLSLIEKKKIVGFWSSLSCATFYYLLKKKEGHKKAIAILKNIMQILKTAAVDEKLIENAIKLSFDDFEDAIQYCCAKSSKVNLIITRNTKDFKKVDIQALEPATFLSSLNS